MATNGTCGKCRPSCGRLRTPSESSRPSTHSCSGSERRQQKNSISLLRKPTCLLGVRVASRWFPQARAGQVLNSLAFFQQLQIRQAAVALSLQQGSRKGCLKSSCSTISYTRAVLARCDMSLASFTEMQEKR